MARQRGLFPEPDVTVSVDASRNEPRVWVERFVIWEKPGEIIRDIRLRRGLNIIWSPDPGAAAAELGQDAGSGHGAGKTLFCRLLRYCLGEERFSNDELRKAIVEALPAGLVGAEVVIQGNKWAVIRPIGQTRKEYARQGGSLEDLINSKETSDGIQPLVDALNASLFPSSIGQCLPVERSDAAWLLALAWLARDQECRFDHTLDWRHAKADSRSIATGLSREQTLIVVRTFLEMIEEEELRLKSEREKLADEKRKLERNSAYSERRRKEILSDLRPAQELDFDLASGGDLVASSFREHIEENLARLEKEIEELRQRDDTAKDRAALETVFADIAVLESKVKDLENTSVIHEEQLKALRGERANLTAAEIKARLGPVCPVCSVPIDRALAEGCGLSHHFRDPARIAGEKRDLSDQMQDCNQAIAECKRLTSENRAGLSRLRQRESELRANIGEHEKRSSDRQRNARQEWYSAKQLLEQAKDQQRLWSGIESAKDELSGLSRRDQEIAEQQAVLRGKHKTSLSRFEALFSYVCQAALGSKVPASVTLSGQGLQTHVDVGGMAMESLKAIAFDIATILMAIEGHGHLPAFLVHDSPREADLGEAIYHRLFRLMQKLESASRPSPFQYIITTTTTPPADLCGPPYLIAELHGSEIEGRLLQRNLG